MEAARLLLVEPDDAARATLQSAASRFIDVEGHREFATAHARLRVDPFAFLVTNLRLHAFNGLHLVYLSSSGGEGASPCAIVYSVERDLSLAREIHKAGAFYELASCLPVTIAAYLTAQLPARDRRNPAYGDRRQLFRGGRRCWDHHLASRTK
jgi:DNA-binding NtrC family response regulator